MMTTFVRAGMTLACLILAFACQAGTVYDLQADFSDASNPNGPWSYRQGNTPMPHQSTVFSYPSPAWAPSPNQGSFLPFIARTTWDSPNDDWLTGDIIMHPVDSSNGFPSNGEGNVAWTAAVAASIRVQGVIWWAHSANRIDDYSLVLNGSPLLGGTVGYNTGETRATPEAFDTGWFNVAAGDVVALFASKNAASPDGFPGLVGINLVVTENASAVPEPAGLGLLGGIALAFFAARRRR